MPTLQQLTLALSQRLSEIYRNRDSRVAAVNELRDRSLRALPAAVKAFQKHDETISVAREKQVAADAKAEAARSVGLVSAVDRRSDRLEDAQQSRRSTDIAAVIAKREGEEEAERRYKTALDDLDDIPARDRQKAALDADRARRTRIEEARRSHDQAVDAAQQKYRGSVDQALIAERRETRDGERAYHDALTLGGSTTEGARAFANQMLADALARIPEAVEIEHACREQLAAIAAEANQAEAEAFARFRQELTALKK